MILLDTDHISVLKYENHPRSLRLQERLNVASETEQIATTIISIEEQLRGLLARIHSEHRLEVQIECYEQLADLFEFFDRWDIIQFDSEAADELVLLRQNRIRVGAHDMKIASIALAQDALLLSANIRDFNRVPGLRVEDWLS